jgi:hypothetical protein
MLNERSATILATNKAVIQEYFLIIALWFCHILLVWSIVINILEAPEDSKFFRNVCTLKDVTSQKTAVIIATAM